MDVLTVLYNRQTYGASSKTTEAHSATSDVCQCQRDVRLPFQLQIEAIRSEKKIRKKQQEHNEHNAHKNVIRYLLDYVANGHPLHHRLHMSFRELVGPTFTGVL